MSCLLDVAGFLPLYVGIDLGDPAAVFWGAMWGAPLEGSSPLRGLAHGFRAIFPFPPVVTVVIRSRLLSATRCRRYREIYLPLLALFRGLGSGY